MKFSCLSEGKGYDFPPSHILDICEFRVLFDCPLDFSALSIFYPVPNEVDHVQDKQASECGSSQSESINSGSQKPLEGCSLIHDVPWYKGVKHLKLLDASFIDVILISSPMGMLGLPFLSRIKGFSAQIYATEATIKLGQLMMEDLVTMHKEFIQFYGPEHLNAPVWMKWDEIESLPSALRNILSGEDGRDLGGWMPLYSAADVKYCMQKVQSLKYAEEACYNGTLIIQAFNSGLDIGTSNWKIVSPKQSVSYTSISSFASATSHGFDYNALKGSDVVLFSDFTTCDFLNEHDKDVDTSCSEDIDLVETSDTDEKRISEFLNAEEYEKLAFLCDCSLHSVKAGGSVLIPIGRLSIVLELLEQISSLLKSSDLKVPIYVVSSYAEELFSFLNVIPEWLSEERKDRLYSGQPFFCHLELLKEKRLFLFPSIHSLEFLRTWQEPCIIFCPHWSLRLGPAVHFLRRWSEDENSLLVMEDGMNSNLTFLPFKSMAMKVLQCSFLSGIKMQKVETILRMLKPKYVLFSEKLKHRNSCKLFEFIYYSEGKTVEVPNLSDSAGLDIAVELTCLLNYTKPQKDFSIARVEGELLIEKGKNRLLKTGGHVPSLQTRPMQYMGQLDLEMFITALEEKGMSVKVEEVMNDDVFKKVNLGRVLKPCALEEKGMSVKVEEVMNDDVFKNVNLVRVLKPCEALIEVRKGRIIISTADEKIASQISQVLSNMLDLL